DPDDSGTFQNRGYLPAYTLSRESILHKSYRKQHEGFHTVLGNERSHISRREFLLLPPLLSAFRHGVTRGTRTCAIYPVPSLSDHHGTRRGTPHPGQKDFPPARNSIVFAMRHNNPTGYMHL